MCSLSTSRYSHISLIVALCMVFLYRLPQVYTNNTISPVIVTVTEIYRKQIQHSLDPFIVVVVIVRTLIAPSLDGPTFNSKKALHLSGARRTTTFSKTDRYRPTSSISRVGNAEETAEKGRLLRLEFRCVSFKNRVSSVKISRQRHMHCSLSLNTSNYYRHNPFC